MRQKSDPGRPATRYLHSGKLRLAFDRRGREGGTCVVLLHGGGQSRHSWEQTAGLLGDAGYEVFTMDLRGHGESDWAGDGAYSVSDQISDLAALLDLAGRPVVLVGASLGGLLCVIVTGERMHDVRALVLVDATPTLATSGTDRIHDFMRSGADGFASVADAAEAVAAYLPMRSRPSDPTRLMRNLRLRDGRYYWHWDPAILVAKPGVGETQAAQLATAARRIAVPTLLLRGALSDVVTGDEVAALLSQIPHAEVREIDGAGHMVSGDQNTAFAGELLAFLARLGPEAG